MKLIEDVGFDFSYSFVYSQRPGTPAADLADETPEELKKNVSTPCNIASTSKVSRSADKWSAPSSGFW